MARAGARGDPETDLADPPVGGDLLVGLEHDRDGLGAALDLHLGEDLEVANVDPAGDVLGGEFDGVVGGGDAVLPVA